MAPNRRSRGSVSLLASVSTWRNTDTTLKPCLHVLVARLGAAQVYFAVPEWIKTYWDYPLVQKAKEDLTYQVPPHLPQGLSCVGQFVLLLVSRLHGLYAMPSALWWRAR